MIRLYAYDSQTFYEGAKWELDNLLQFLRVEDKKQFYKAKFLLRKFAYFRSIDDEEERTKKIEQIREQAKYIRFYDGRSKSFLTGLLPRVLKKLKKNHIKFRLEDNRSLIPDFDLKFNRFSFKDRVEDRPEQIDVVKAALEKKRGILHCATNFGKTEVAAAIIAEYTRQKKSPRVLFIVHRVQLVNQTAERFKQHLDLPVTVIGGGKKKIRKNGILVASTQTAIKLLGNARFGEFLDKCDIFFIDEFHINKAWTCTKIAKACLAPMRFGLSGTIDEKNIIKMMHYKGMTGPIIAAVRNEQLVNLGRSARPIARFVDVQAPTIPKSLKYAGAYRFGIVHNEIRNGLVLKEIVRYLNEDRPVLVTVARIKHGLILKSLLSKTIDLPIEFLSGGTPVPVRNTVLQKFKKGKVSVLIASPIFDTGVDIPDTNFSWVNAAGGKGWELVLQRLGRVLRKKKGENKVYISDFVDHHNRYLMKHSLARIEHYQNEKIVEIKIIGA